jgi:Fe-S cluster assembly iron-binding protein IscA
VTTMTTSVNIGKKPAPVTLSDLAIVKVAELLAQEEGEALALRVAVKPGGCSGYSYEMFFDSESWPTTWSASSAPSRSWSTRPAPSC